jgi:hypothetical protein
MAGKQGGLAGATTIKNRHESYFMRFCNIFTQRIRSDQRIQNSPLVVFRSVGKVCMPVSWMKFAQKLMLNFCNNP